MIAVPGALAASTASDPWSRPSPLSTPGSASPAPTSTPSPCWKPAPPAPTALAAHDFVGWHRRRSESLHGQILPIHQSGCETTSDHLLENLQEHTRLTKAPMAILGEGRVDGDLCPKVQPRKPAVGQVQL